jgi:hypothetical protein
VIISNCVINLSGDKDQLLREAFRVLKPGGRFGVSEVVTRGEVPKAVRQNILLWVGCIAGAMRDQEYRAKLRAAGFGASRLSRRGFMTVRSANHPSGLFQCGPCLRAHEMAEGRAFGSRPESGAALATVVGVLVEVPVMLSVCAACNRTRHWFPTVLRDNA